MRFFKWYAMLLIIIMSQAIAGCGGGGGGSTGIVAVISPLTDTTAPTVNAFTLPATSSSMIVTIVNFSATDAVGVTGYLITESAMTPSAAAAGWSATVPTSYLFSGAGNLTAYAWAKDAAGNVSTSGSAIVTIILSDTIPPTVDAFTMPATSASTTVAISSLIATDAVGITGYLVTESAVAPSAIAVDWYTTAPISFTFSATGNRIAYAWAKDAAGHVSASRSANVTITTKMITLKFISQSTNLGDLIGGFLLTVILPPGSVLQVDSSGNPLSSVVYLSGQFAGASPQINTYNSVSRELTINYASSNAYLLGEFMTVIATVPSSYVPNTSDIAVYNAFTPITGVNMPSVTATLSSI